MCVRFSCQKEAELLQHSFFRCFVQGLGVDPRLACGFFSMKSLLYIACGLQTSNGYYALLVNGTSNLEYFKNTSSRVKTRNGIVLDILYDKNVPILNRIFYNYQHTFLPKDVVDLQSERTGDLIQGFEQLTDLVLGLSQRSVSIRNGKLCLE